ncbi:MAG: hypothetical protein KDA45_03595 [Planctomycetales bacterium]|nr:hypothetical protein [Planctomycetales bacterium]
MWPFPDNRAPPPFAVAQQINKRLTLNLLIQGAAAHTFVSASHVVEAELEQLRPGLTQLYNRVAISGQLNYCIGENALMFGRPNRWWGFSPVPQTPFRQHRLLARYGNSLAREETRHLRQRARGKGLCTWPLFHWFQFMGLMAKVTWQEKGLALPLTRIAVTAASRIWDIPEQRLDAALTMQPAFGHLQRPRTRLGRMCRQGVIGYGGVERREGRFVVMARAWVFPILLHELVKGIVELICLHGLGDLDESVYRAVTEEADQLEYEAWLLQAGPAMWRRLLAVAPRGQSLAHTVMSIAQLQPQRLEDLMLMVIEQPQQAAVALTKLGG